MRITWIGDSLAAGLGCDDVADTPAHLAARLLERPVDVTMLAVPGSKASDVIDDQLDHVDPYTDLVVLCVGANDVATSVARSVYAQQVDQILTALAPIPVVMLTLPDISMADRMAEPLRTPRRRPRPLLRGRPRQGRRPPRPRRVGRHRQPARRPRAAAPVAGCSAPIASTPAPRATGCGPSASPPRAATMLEPPGSRFHPSRFA